MSFTIGQGITISSGITFSSTPSGILVTFSEFSPDGLYPGGDIEDNSGSFNIPTGFTINNGTAGFGGGGGSGVAMYNLTTETLAAFAADPNNNGYVWNVTWAAGSTYTTTPVAMYFDGTGITFWVLDPADTSYNTAVNVATCNYPAYFSSTTTLTSFQN